jgi:hypothetical protein
LEADGEALKQWEKDNPAPEPSRELFVIDATLEKIGQYLDQKETCGMVAFHDELSMWFAQLKRGKDALDQRANWLSLWTGGLLKVDRVGRERIYVANTAQSVFGNATIDGLANIRAANKPKNGNADADGMWARFLVWRPNHHRYEHNDLDVDVTDLLYDLFRNKIDSKLPPLGDSGPTMITLSSAAVALMSPHWKGWDEESENTTRERGQWLGKLRGHSVRLAGILHVLDCATKELPLTSDITEETARRALRLCDALLAQYDLLCPAIGGDTGNLDPAVARLLAHGIDWRRNHGAAPVPSEQLRRWQLPTREATASERREWLLGVVAPDGSMGTVETTSRSFQWHPPG